MAITGNTLAGINSAALTQILNIKYSTNTMRRAYLSAHPVMRRMFEKSARFLDNEISPSNLEFNMRIKKRRAGGYGGYGAQGAHNAFVPSQYASIAIKSCFAHFAVTVDIRNAPVAGLKEKESTENFVSLFHDGVMDNMDLAHNINEINLFAASPAQLGTVGTNTTSTYNASTDDTTITYVGPLLNMLEGCRIDIWDATFTTKRCSTYIKSKSAVDGDGTAATHSIVVDDDQSSAGIVATDVITVYNLRNQLNGFVEGFVPAIGTTTNTYPASTSLGGTGIDRSASGNAYFQPFTLDASTVTHTNGTIVEIADYFMEKLALRWPDWDDSYAPKEQFVATNKAVRNNYMRNNLNAFGQYIITDHKGGPDTGMNFASSVPLDGIDLVASPYCTSNVMFVVMPSSWTYGEYAMGEHYSKFDGGPYFRPLSLSGGGTANLEAPFFFNWQLVCPEPYRNGYLYGLNLSAGAPTSNAEVSI